MPLVSGKQVPLKCLRITLGHAKPFVMRSTNICLSVWIIAFRGLRIPLKRFNMILRCAKALCIERTNLILVFRQTGFSGNHEAAEGILGSPFRLPGPRLGPVVPRSKSIQHHLLPASHSSDPVGALLARPCYTLSS